MQSLPTVLLTGTAGAGKTAVAKEIGELLRRVGVRYAVIDLDAELSRLALEDFAVDNDATKSVTGVALEVLDRLGWPEAALAEGAAADAGLV
jgi:adenylylsulfate kinase-like enzyme